MIFGQGMTEHNEYFREPLPSLGRMMVFIDGENLVFRYESMIKDDAEPSTLIDYEPKTFVWRANSIKPELNTILRANYYTYVTGDDNKVNEIKTKIKNLNFHNYSTQYHNISVKQLPNNLTPVVFKKTKGEKAKGVDIQMSVDILTHVFRNNIDIVYLVSGDGDYLPVLQEAVRMGKQVYVAAFSSGLNESLVTIADKFRLLDPIYFKLPKQENNGNE